MTRRPTPRPPRPQARTRRQPGSAPAPAPTLAALLVRGVACVVLVTACTGEEAPVPPGQFAPSAAPRPTATTPPSGRPTAGADGTTDGSPTTERTAPSPGAPSSAPSTAPPSGTPRPGEVATTPDPPDDGGVGLDHDDVDRTDPAVVAGTFVCALYASPVEPEDVADIAGRVAPLATDEVVEDLQTLSFHGDAGEYREASVTGLAELGGDTWDVTCFVVFREAESDAPSQPPETVAGRVHLVEDPDGSWRVDAFEQLV